MSKQNTVMKKRMHAWLACTTIGLLSSLSASAQGTLIAETLPNSDNEPAPVFPVPSDRQIKWQETEFYAFFHYGMNTFTGKEWGTGGEPETTYAPQQLPNCLQWIQSVKAAGMKGGIAVVKHHDGFCLWPTQSTTHSVLNSKGAGPSVNVPDLFSKACQQEGMKYGFYVSPWDRNSAYYGKPEYVKQVFLKQVSELAKYGSDQFEMWFDGANGGDGYYGGANETRSIDASTYYDMPNLADSIHKLQPNCVIWGGTEARWIGNEDGWAGVTHWSTDNKPTVGAGENGYEQGWAWLPGESDAKGTNAGWFWHSTETPLSADALFDIYMKTVGRNATLILNLPPNRDGVLPDTTVATLKSMGRLLKARFTTDYAKTATVAASEERTAGAARNYKVTNLTDGNTDTYWATNDATRNGATITFTWANAVTVHYVMLQEYIRLGQRVKSFRVEGSSDGSHWTAYDTANSTTIGYKRIFPLNGSTTSYGNGYSLKGLRITITDSKACPLLHTVSIF